MTRTHTGPRVQKENIQVVYDDGRPNSVCVCVYVCPAGQ
jgi:hypothetical protein